jgi:hypothetical protein
VLLWLFFLLLAGGCPRIKVKANLDHWQLFQQHYSLPCGMSVAVCAGAAASGGVSLQDATSRNPPLFISLSAIREALKSDAALLASSAMVVDPNMRLKQKAKKQAPAAPTAAAAASSQDNSYGPPLPQQK